MLVLTPRALSFLLGANDPAPEVRSVVRAVRPVPLAAPYAEVLGHLAALVRTDPHPPVLQLVGGAGAEAVAAGLADELGLIALRLDAGPALRGSTADLEGLLEREMALLPALLFVDADDVPAESRPLLPALLARLGGTVVVGTANRLDLPCETVAKRVAEPTTAERVAQWAAAGATVPAEALARVAGQFRLDPAAVSAVVAEARLQGGGADALWAAAREVVGRDLADCADRIEPRRRLGDLVLPEDRTALLRDLVDQVRHARTVFEDWGFDRVVPRGQGVTALFSGPSGTGKTMAAEVVAVELGSTSSGWTCPRW